MYPTDIFMVQALEAIQIFSWWLAGVAGAMIAHAFLCSFSMQAAFVLPAIVLLLGGISQFLQDDLRVWSYIVCSAIAVGVVLWLIP